MIGESNRPRLAGIRPAPLCREAEQSSRMMKASSLPSLARLGMFKASNDAKSRFIHKHMREATARAQTSLEAVDSMRGPLPRHWGGPPEFPLAKVSEPLAVMATEAALEDYKRCHRERKNDVRSVCGRGISGDGSRQNQRLGASTSRPIRRARSRLPRNSNQDHRDHHDNHLRRRKHPRHQREKQHDHLYDPGGHHGHQPQERYSQHQPLQPQNYRPPSTHAVVLPQGKGLKGLVLIGEDGVRKSKFPRGCEASPGVRAATAAPTASRGRGKENDDVLSRLCNPKLYTGTAATGHLPQVVDLEGGAGVLLKGASIAVKDHIGAQEVSWRLRLAERL